MHFVRLREAIGDLYEEAMALYGDSFPVHEQRRTEAQAKIMGIDEYQFNLIYDEQDMVGIILCWETERYIYVEHFCVKPAMRNKRYGKRALELLAARGKTIILEIDPPVDEIAIHRQGFYEREGYIANHFSHIHPPYRAGYGGHSLVVMSYPTAISKGEYDEFNKYLAENVMKCEI